MKYIEYQLLSRELKKRYLAKLYEGSLDFQPYPLKPNHVKALLKVQSGPRMFVITSQSEMETLRIKAEGINFESETEHTHKAHYELPKNLPFPEIASDSESKHHFHVHSPPKNKKISDTYHLDQIPMGLQVTDEYRAGPKTRVNLERLDLNMNLERELLEPNEYVERTNHLVMPHDNEDRDYLYGRLIDEVRKRDHKNRHWNELLNTNLVMDDYENARALSEYETGNAKVDYAEQLGLDDEVDWVQNAKDYREKRNQKITNLETEIAAERQGQKEAQILERSRVREEKLQAFNEEESKRRLEHEKVKREKNERKLLRLGEEEKSALLRLGEEEKSTRDRQRFLDEDKLEHEQRMSQIREERDRVRRKISFELAFEEAHEKKFDKKSFQERATSKDVVDRIEKLRAESDYNVKCAKDALNIEGFSNVNDVFDADYIKSLYGGVVNNNGRSDSNNSVCVELNFGDEPVKHSNG